MSERPATKDQQVLTAPNEWAALEELASDGPLLLVFYLFDWSST